MGALLALSNTMCVLYVTWSDKRRFSYMIFMALVSMLCIFMLYIYIDWIITYMIIIIYIIVDQLLQLPPSDYS